MNEEKASYIKHFNSRPRKEVDNSNQKFALYTKHFNSRPRKEVDFEWMRQNDYLIISTHDLARRSTMFAQSKSSQIKISTHDLARRSTVRKMVCHSCCIFQLTTSQGGRQQFLRKKFSFQNHFLCSLHILYSYYINIVFFSTLFLAKSSFFLVRIP